MQCVEMFSERVFLVVFSRDISVKFLGSRTYYESFKKSYENLVAGNLISSF